MRKDILSVSILYWLFLAGYAAIGLMTGRCDRCFANLFSNNFLTALALLGGVLGFARVWRAGMLRLPAAVVTSLSAGLVAWSFGSALWTYYNFRLGDSIPYPSWADAGYFPQSVLTFCAIVACFWMTKRRFDVQLFTAQAAVVAAVPALYALFRSVRAAEKFKDDADILKCIFDVAYPVAASGNLALLAIFLTGAALRTFPEHVQRELATSLGFLLAGTLFLGLGDLFFNIGTSVPAGSLFRYTNGSWMDAVYLTGLWGVSIAALSFPVVMPGATTAAVIAPPRAAQAGSGGDDS